MKKQELGIYIHIPFCKRKCYYCDFISYDNKCNEIPEYIESLSQEIEEFDFSNYQTNSIYIGGGTPSYMDSKYINKIVDKIYQKANCKNAEITIEVNPGTVTLEKLKEYKKDGINRLSIGLQSTNNKILQNIGRIHTYEDLLNTYKLAKEVGFKNINVDLMIGLPNQTIQDLKASLKKIIKLNPNHISIYSLIVEEGTIIEKLLNEGKITLPKEEQERRMYWYVKDTLELNGYHHYEISNFSKEGKESRHNLNCWNQEEYVGFGVGAHSYINNIRFSNTKSIEEYIKNITNNCKEKNMIIEEKQSLQDKENEFMLLGFRKIEGIEITKFKEKFIENPIFLYKERLQKLEKEGLINIDLNNIKLTNKGLDLANIVFEEFI